MNIAHFLKRLVQADKSDDNVNYSFEISRFESFYTKIVGVTYPNDDGTSKQKILAKCRIGENLILKHTPIPEDDNAVKVLRKNGDQIGWLSSAVAREISALLDQGCRVDAVISDLTGGTKDKPTRGCNINVTKYY